MIQLVWLAVAFPLLGAVINAALAFRRPMARTAVSIVGVGVMAAAFAVALAVFRELQQSPVASFPVVLWHWMPVTDRLSIDLAFMVDHLSVVMLLVMRVMTHKVFGLKQPGLVAGAWLIWYAIARIICEFFREPESLHALNIEPFTAGQVYCLPMLAFGLYLVLTARRSPSVEKPAA